MSCYDTFTELISEQKKIKGILTEVEMPLIVTSRLLHMDTIWL